MTVKIITLLYFTIFTLGQKLEDDNICYIGVKPKLQDLIEFYKKSPSISTPVAFPDIKSLISEIENLYLSNIIDLEDAFKKSQAIQSIIKNEYKQVEDLKKILYLLNTIIKYMDEVNQRNKIHDEAFNTCTETNQMYLKLREDVNKINETGNFLKAVIEKIAKQAEDINTKNMKVKNDLDATNIPVSIFQQYVCDANLQSTIQTIIDSIRNIADILRYKFKGIIQQKLQELENENVKTKNDINEIEKSLENEIPNTDIQTTDETQQTIENLENKIKDLKDKLANIKLDETNNEFLQTVKEKFKKLSHEYETIVKHLLSKENMDKVKEELEKARKTLQIVKNRDVFKKELQDVKKIVDALEKGGVCLKNTVSVEE